MFGAPLPHMNVGAPTPPLRIMVLGASESAKNGVMDYTWPKRLEHLLQSGTGTRDVDVRTLAISGSTYYRANGNGAGANQYGTLSMVQEAIVWKPDVIITLFGGNDCMNAADARTLANIKADADTLYSTLRAALPACLIIYCYEQTHDPVGFPLVVAGTTGSCKNKGIASQFMTLKAGATYLAGIIDNCWSSEMLEDIIPDGTLTPFIDYRTRLSNIIALDDYIRVGPSTSFNIIGVNRIILNFWKLQRLGVTLPDMAHHNVAAHQLMAAWVYKQLKANAAFAALVPHLSTQIINSWQDPDALFDYYLTPSGDGYVSGTVGIPGLNGDDVDRFWGDQTIISPAEWYRPFKTKFAIWPANQTITNTGEWAGSFRLMIRNGPPGQQCFLSVANGAFFASGEFTDTNGNFETTVMGLFASAAPATYVLRVKVGTEVYGPFNMIVTAALQQTQTQSDATAAAFTITAAKIAGARDCAVNMTALGANGNLTLPTCANLVAAIPGCFNGFTYRLRIINSTAAGAFTWTLTDNAGVAVVVGTRTIPQNTWRDFQVTFNGALTVATFTSIGTGTNS